MTVKKRDVTIDLLRAWATISIFVTHAEVPRPYYYVRAFEVIILVFLSSMSFALSSYEFNPSSYRKYVIKRLWRIVKPLWALLVLYFVLFIFVFHVPYTWKEILASFAMTSSGIGLVWIYRIFCTIALTMPLLKKTALEKPVWMIVLVSILLLIANDGLYHTVLIHSKVLTLIITYTVSYTIASTLGMMNVRLNGKQRYLIGGIFLCIALACFIVTKNPDCEAYKYPPQIYFVSYGLGMSFVLYELCSHIKNYNPIFLKVITWISSQAMNLYLWHIIFYHLDSLGIISIPHSFIPLFTYYMVTAFVPTYLVYKLRGYLKHA
ncbi:MAG: acyltransferase [Solobacterium sp.]|nr:acyltransferase [Solobacterium sp.]